MGGDILYSGGAEGADTLFGECASKHHHRIVHLGFHGQKSNQPLYILEDWQLQEADEHLVEANKHLYRTFPTKSEHTNNLLRRNWWQVKHSKKVYAVAPIEDTQMLKGGTAWAVIMGILRKIPEIYVFDERWYMWDYKGAHWNLYTGIPPLPYGQYTGIGSRKLTDAGRKAIKDLYGNEDNL